MDLNADILRGVIVIASFAGFFLAAHIHHTKRQQKTLVCPFGTNCTAVVHGEFSTFFGIPVELLGILYYTFVGAWYAVFLIVSDLALPAAVFLTLTLTTTAFLFSLYLTFIQAVVLKQWCTWCLTSAALCTIIFAAAILSSPHNVPSLLAHYRTVIVLAHVFGFALGLGGALITDILFSRFLRDFKITADEASVMRVLSQVIWFALAILVVSGVALYIPKAEILNRSAKFLVKMEVVLVLIVNGVLLNLLVAPKLVRLAFTGSVPPNLSFLRKLSFALGAVSLTSWMTALVLGSLPSVPLGFTPLLLVYVGALFVAVLVSQVVERTVVHRAQRAESGMWTPMG